MPFALAEAAAGLLALSALLLLPGLLVVRSPWPFVPFFSLSFWVVSWGWLTPAGPGRERFLHVALASSAALAALRLFKPLEASRPTWPTTAVAIAALARLAPFSTWPAAPGLDAGFASSSALLLTWRDGIPASYQPLLPLSGFGAGGFGLPALAADLSLLTGIPAWRALLLAALASEGLFVLALFAFARRSFAPSPAALASIAAAALALLGVARSEGDVGAALAFALAVSGASLALRGTGRSTCVAAGLFWAAALVTLPISGAVAVGVAIAAAAAAAGEADLGRLGLSGTVAALLAAPVLWRTSPTLDLSGARLPPLTWALSAAVVVVAAAGRLPRLAPPRGVTAVIGAVALGATLLDWNFRTARLQVSADDLAVAGWLREHSRPTDRVCTEDEALRAWMPALAGRAVHPARLPGAIRVQPVDAAPPCRFHASRRASAGSAPESLFRRGKVELAHSSP